MEDSRNSSNGSSALVSSTLNQHTSRSNSLSFDPENTNTNPNQNTHEYDDSPSCQANDDITDEEIRITLISSVEDKLKNKMEEEVSKTQAEIQCLHHTNRELLDRQEDICKIGKDLDEQLSNLTQYTDDLQSCENELQLAITDLEQKIKVCLKWLMRCSKLSRIFLFYNLDTTSKVNSKNYFSQFRK